MRIGETGDVQTIGLTGCNPGIGVEEQNGVDG